MAFLIPYVINGAKHSAELFRRQAQRPATDQNGVSRPGDLKVTQLPQAGAGFRVAIGGLSLRSRFPGHERESYGVENSGAALDVTGVEGTGSSARRDAVVVEVLDPNYLPITHEEAALSNYMSIEVVQNVPTAKDISGVPGFANRTAYVLAFIEWPENQTSIQESYLKDARRTANPILGRVLGSVDLTGTGAARTGITNTVAYPAGGQTWPVQAEQFGGLEIEIPEDATHMVYAATWAQLSVNQGNGNAWGGMWLQIGANADPDVWRGKRGAWDVAEDGGSHTMMMRVAETVKIPEELRGTRKRFYPKAMRSSGVTAGTPHLVSASTFDLDVSFESRAV